MKANPERGESPLIVDRDGVEAEYVLKVHNNSVAALEGRRQQSFSEILEKAEKIDVTAIRDVLFALLQKHHADEFPNLNSVGDLMDEYGGPVLTWRAITATLALNVPDDAKQKNPRKAPVSTGGSSTSKRVA